MTAVTLVTKACRDCGEEKPASEFHRDPRNKDGLHSYCKGCNKRRVRASQEARRAELGDEEYRRRQAQMVRRSRLNPDVRERSRLASRVAYEALRRLRENHRDEYERLLALVWDEADRGLFE